VRKFEFLKSSLSEPSKFLWHESRKKMKKNFVKKIFFLKKSTCTDSNRELPILSKGIAWEKILWKTQISVSHFLMTKKS